MRVFCEAGSVLPQSFEVRTKVGCNGERTKKLLHDVPSFGSYNTFFFVSNRGVVSQVATGLDSYRSIALNSKKKL